MSDPMSPAPDDIDDLESEEGTEPPQSHSNFSQVHGHGIWSWDITVSTWLLIEDRSEFGFEIGLGPTGPGRFHGQTVRWACVPKRD